MSEHIPDIVKIQVTFSWLTVQTSLSVQKDLTNDINYFYNCTATKQLSQYNFTNLCSRHC